VRHRKLEPPAQQGCSDENRPRSLRPRQVVMQQIDANLYRYCTPRFRSSGLIVYQLEAGTLVCLPPLSGSGV
jgi:hypothetical protein